MLQLKQPVLLRPAQGQTVSSTNTTAGEEEVPQQQLGIIAWLPSSNHESSHRSQGGAKHAWVLKESGESAVVNQ